MLPRGLQLEMLLLLLLAFSGVAFAESSKPYLPVPVPVNIKPSAREGKLFGMGANRITVVSKWEDNFFTSQSEKIGETEVTASNVALGWIRNSGWRYSSEWDIVAGKLELKSKTKNYTSTIIGKTVNVQASGDGFDVGLRYLGGYSLAKSEFVDWNLALSLHAALYTLENVYKADSSDGLDSNHYDATETGIFLRPAIAFQPIFDAGPFSLVPYVGTNAMVIVGVESYEDKRYVRNGVAGRLTEDSELAASARSFELVYGFDLGFISPFSREHKGTVGGALSKLYGNSSGDFSEIHAFYAVPFGKK